MCVNPAGLECLATGCYSTFCCVFVQDMYGLNLAGLEFLKRELGSKGTRVFEDAPTILRKKRKMTYGQ